MSDRVLVDAGKVIGRSKSATEDGKAIGHYIRKSGCSPADMTLDVSSIDPVNFITAFTNAIVIFATEDHAIDLKSFLHLQWKSKYPGEEARLARAMANAVDELSRKQDPC